MPDKVDSKAPDDGKAKGGDAKESTSLSQTKDSKGSSNPKGAPEDLDTEEEDVGLEPKGDPKGAGAVDETGSGPEDAKGLEPKGAPKGSAAFDDTEPLPKGAPKGSDTDEDSGLATKGALKGSDTVDEIGLPAKVAPKGPGSNQAPTKKASPPVEVHMIGVKLAPGKKKGNTAVVSSSTTTDNCTERTNMMAKKLGSFASPCILDPSGACVPPAGIKKGGGKRNLEKSSCGTKGSKKKGSKGSKKRHV